MQDQEEQAQETDMSIKMSGKNYSNTALGGQAVPTNSNWEKQQNRKEALMYAVNSFGVPAQENGVDVDQVIERAKKFEAYLNRE